MYRFLPLAALLCFGLAVIGPPLLSAKTIPGIDDLPISSWLWCNDCASKNNNTNATAGIKKITQSGYTVDGQSVRFDLIKNCSGSCGYGNVFFYNNVAQNVTENSVTIDMYAMMDSVGNANSQAVEFTVEDNVCKINCGQSNEEDFRYIYSLQCDFNGGFWRVWNGSGGNPTGSGEWVATSHHCVPFQAGSFNHLTFHFTKSPENVTYTDMVINGTTYPINLKYGIEYDTPNHHGNFVASVQLDGNSTQGEYSMWVDKWSIIYQ